MSVWLTWHATNWISGLPRDSPDDPRRPCDVGSGPEGFERESWVSGSSCCALMWRHWPAASRPSLSLSPNGALPPTRSYGVPWPASLLVILSWRIAANVRARSMPVVDASVVIDWVAPV